MASSGGSVGHWGSLGSKWMSLVADNRAGTDSAALNLEMVEHVVPMDLEKRTPSRTGGCGAWISSQ